MARYRLHTVTRGPTAWNPSSSSSSSSRKIPRDCSSYTLVDRTLWHIWIRLDEDIWFLSAPQSDWIWKTISCQGISRRYGFLVLTDADVHHHGIEDPVVLSASASRTSISSHFTAGASAARGTKPKPAARTATACSNPMMNLTPREI